VLAHSPDLATRMAHAIRALSMDAVEQARSGHVGLPLGMADVATVLFTEFLKFDPADPQWADRDRFVLSAGHGSMLQYALLHLCGYDLPLSAIVNFRQLHSGTPGHPEFGDTPGVETTTGPLGQGLATAVGMALAERHMNARFGDGLVDHKTYVIAGDGCLMEGISQEAITLAGHLKLNRLIVLFDDNAVTIDGGTDLADNTDQLARFAASGWAVEAVDGHDRDAVRAALARAQTSAVPVLIACKTIIGFGAPTLAGTGKAHGGPYGAEEVAGIRKALGWDLPPFELPDDVVAAWRAAGARGGPVRQAWEQRHAASGQAADFDRAVATALPSDLEAKVIAHKKAVIAGGKDQATRQWSGAVLEVLTEAIPEMIGGSADLTGSNNTRTKATAPLTSANYAGRYIHYGVREHAMAAVMNGMALHGGVIPYSGTFLTFADYSRAAIRLGALMGQRVVHVMTHDSIGLGEDGPTHQPVEHVASLRLMPNMVVFRPCDGVETAECWELALKRSHGPSVMALTRQTVKSVRKTHTDENLSARGGYILSEADGEMKAVLIATGSEVEIAMAAQDRLRAEGIAVRVVSMPSMEVFAEQGRDWHAHVLGAPGTPRVVVEAGVRFGWDRWLGERGAFVGMTGFGASAPYKTLYEHFGITPEAAMAAVRALV